MTFIPELQELVDKKELKSYDFRNVPCGDEHGNTHHRLTLVFPSGVEVVVIPITELSINVYVRD